MDGASHVPPALREPRRFDGTLGEDVQLWLEHLEKVKHLNGWDANTTLMIVEEYIGDAVRFAWAEYKMVNDVVKPSLVKFQEFIKATYMNKPRKAYLIKRLAARKKQINETFYDYVSNIAAMCLEIDQKMEVVDIAESVASGIVEPALTRFRAREVKSIRDLFEIASTLDSDGKPMGQREHQQQKGEKDNASKQNTHQMETRSKGKVKSRCHFCNKVGHYERECRLKKKEEKTSDKKTSEKRASDKINQVGDEFFWVDASLGDAGTSCRMLVDTGASFTILDKRSAVLLPEIMKVDASANLLGGNSLKIDGLCKVDIKVCGQSHVVEARICETDYNILGQDWLVAAKATINVKDKRLEFTASVTKEEVTSLLKKLELDGKYPPAAHGIKPITLNVREGAKPVVKKPYALPYAQRKHIETEIKAMLADGIVEASNSEWRSPIFTVPKGENGYRIVTDFRAVNQILEPEHYPLPNATELLTFINGARYFSKIDLAAAFNQLKLAAESRKYTAFTVPTLGHFHFKRLPFGIASAPAVMQKSIETALGGSLYTRAVVYIDDILVFSKTLSEHYEDVKCVLQALEAHGFRIRGEKSQLCVNETEYLGHVVSASGIRPLRSNVKPIEEFPKPATVKQLRRFLGLCAYYARYIKNYAERTEPLNKLLRRNQEFVWNENCHTSFMELKQELGRLPTLHPPDFNVPFCLTTDASDVGLGAVLSQWIGDQERVIAYASKALSPTERRYSATDKEALGVMFGLEHFKFYVLGHKVKVITDHQALTKFLMQNEPTARNSRWIERIMRYDMEIVHRAGRLIPHVDALSRAPIIAFVEGGAPMDLEQRKDKVLSEVMQWMESKELSSDSSDEVKLLIEKQGHMFVMHDNKLFLNVTERHGNRYLLVVPELMKKMIFDKCHQAGGHPGFKKTLYRIKERFWWKGMAAEVKKWTKICKTCQMVKPPNKAQAAPMTMQTAEGVFSRLNVDFHGPFKPTKSGNRYVFTMSDHFSRFVLLTPVSDQTAETAAEVIVSKFVSVHGVPGMIVSDNGPAFSGGVWKGVCNRLGIVEKHSLPYRPETNGQVERVHRTLDTMLKTMLKKKSEWDSLLPLIQLAMNTQVHDTLGCTPYELVYGRKGKLPMDIELGTHVEDTAVNQNDKIGYLESLQARMKIMHETAKNFALNKQMCQKNSFDARHDTVEYQEGEKVLIDIRAKGKKIKKLGQRYDGPYTIFEKLSNANYIVVGQGKRFKANAGHMKKFHEETPEPLIYVDVSY